MIWSEILILTGDKNNYYILTIMSTPYITKTNYIIWKYKYYTMDPKYRLDKKKIVTILFMKKYGRLNIIF